MTVSFEEYAAQWGCDPVYDRPPRQAGDGYLFYNFSVEGHAKEFLEKFIPAIDRTICGVVERPELYEPADYNQLNELLAECKRRHTEVSNALHKGAASGPPQLG